MQMPCSVTSQAVPLASKLMHDMPSMSASSGKVTWHAALPSPGVCPHSLYLSELRVTGVDVLNHLQGFLAVIGN